MSCLRAYKDIPDLFIFYFFAWTMTAAYIILSLSPRHLPASHENVEWVILYPKPKLTPNDHQESHDSLSLKLERTTCVHSAPSSPSPFAKGCLLLGSSRGFFDGFGWGGASLTVKFKWLRGCGACFMFKVSQLPDGFRCYCRWYDLTLK